MPVYRYNCSCGYNHDQFLKQDVQTKVMVCLRCGRGITARQVRDNTAVIAENNEVHGVLKYDNGQRATR